MTHPIRSGASTLTGRIAAGPSLVYHDEVLAPQFAYESQHLLPWYVAIEKVLLLEYVRLGLASASHVGELARRLDEVTPDRISADPQANLSDIAFAVERFVATGPVTPFSAWHVDRSRNDLQACAQRMAARAALFDAVELVVQVGHTVAEAALRALDLPMPGHTHLQAAQVITPGFFLAGFAAELLAVLDRLETSFGELDQCPLGAGAMAGQELAWDRDRMAQALGFARPVPHALVAVASRGWALSVAADLSGLGVVLSRITTDLMMWGSGGYGFVDLPDELAGISSAMPQKRNFPILERIRGRSAHLTASYTDMAMGQRGTPYTNMVEVSKEAGAPLRALFDTLGSTLRLVDVVVANLDWQTDRMRAAADRDYIGGFSLANRLTLDSGLPWRTAQVVAGRYIVAASERDLPPDQPDADLLATLGLEAGYVIERPGAALTAAFTAGLEARTSAGSAHPDRVRELIDDQAVDHEGHAHRWRVRRSAVSAALAEVDRQLGLSPGGPARPEPKGHS